MGTYKERGLIFLVCPRLLIPAQCSFPGWISSKRALAICRYLSLRLNLTHSPARDICPASPKRPLADALGPQSHREEYRAVHAVCPRLVLPTS